MVIRRLFRRGPDWYDEASAFVDGELAPEQEVAFTQAIAGSAQLQHYVAELQATKAALASLPELEVPRPFTISVAQAQGSPTMTRRQTVERSAPRGAGLLEGTLLMRGAATFSAVAIAALAAVVVVDVTQNDGDSQIFRESAAVSELGGDGANDSETSVAALETAQAADQAIEQAQAQAAPLAPAQAEEQAAEQTMQTTVEPEVELESEADATAATQDQTLPNTGEPQGASEATVASDQLPADAPDESDQAASQQGDPGIAAVADSDDTAEESGAEAEAESQADAESEAVAAAEADTEAAAGTETLDETSSDERAEASPAAPAADADGGESSDSSGPPIEQGTGSGLAEEGDLARAADQAEGSAPPTRDPAPETSTEAIADDGSERPAADEEPAGETRKTAAETVRETEAEQRADQAASGAEDDAGETTTFAQTAAPQEDPGEPDAALRGSESEVVKILEIVLGIAAGLSVLTLLVTLFRRRA